MQNPANARAILMLSLSLVLITSVGAFASPASLFVDGTLSLQSDGRDSLATGFDNRQLPLLTAALVANPPQDVDPDRLYTALTRWHFFAGRHFDPRRTGLWTTGEPEALHGDLAPSDMTLSTGASIELLELEALARLASARGHVFDSIIWWNDHSELRQRLAHALYDPVGGAYVNLDSLGRKSMDPMLSGLIPIALGARHGGAATRRAAWRLWTGTPVRTEQGDLRTGLATRQRAEAFEVWSRDHGLHLISTNAMASLSLKALDELDEPTLAVLARDALAARGITPDDSVEVRLGDWTIKLGTDQIALKPMERSAAALNFLAAIGAYSALRADSLLALTELPTDAPEDSISASITKLTDLLVEMRAKDVRENSGQWTLRRGGQDDLDPSGLAAFDFQWPDLQLWFNRALDLLKADILAWYLRPDYRSNWTAELDPPVVGQGDRPRLRIRSRSARESASLDTVSATLLWTDGNQLLSPAQYSFRKIGDREYESEVPPLPKKNGLWQLMIEGLSQRPRISAAVSVVDPVLVSVLPIERRGTTVEWAVQLRSQIRIPVNGRVDLEAPLSWTSAPGTSLHYSIEPGGANELKFAVTPDNDVAPGSYPLTWTVWSSKSLIGEYKLQVDRPFAWLRVGPLQITDSETPLDSRYAFDRQIDLAARIQGVEGTTAWTRLPAGRVSPDGFVTVAAEGEPEGLHYAFTAFVTQSHEATIEIESEGPAHVYVNGRRVITMNRWGGRREAEVEFGSGTNFIIVKLLDTISVNARFRFRARDIDGQILRGLGNELEHLLENYAYLARARRADGEVQERQTPRLVPIHFNDPSASTVSVVGTFNGWSPNSTKMSRLEDGTWRVKIRLRPGRFEYKFAVDGTDWIPDPNNPEAVDDGFGGRNSVLVVD